MLPKVLTLVALLLLPITLASVAVDEEVILEWLEDFTVLPPDWNATDIANRCNWKGMTCENGEITKIEWLRGGITSAPRIVAPLSSNLHKLEKLQVLTISSANIQGTLPHTIFLAPALERLDIIFSTLHGTIPDTVANATKSLDSNWLHGSLPVSITTLPNLRTLQLSTNMFECPSAQFFLNMNGHPTLAEVDLSDNHFTNNGTHVCGGLIPSLQNVGLVKKSMPASDVSLSSIAGNPDFWFQSSTMFVELRGRRMYFFALNGTAPFREEYLVVEIGGFAELRSNLHRDVRKEVHFDKFLWIEKHSTKELWFAAAKIAGGGDMLWSFDFSAPNPQYGSLKWSFKVENYTYQADDSLFQVSLVIGQVFPTDPRYVSCKNNFEVQDFERHCNLSGAIFESGLQDLNGKIQVGFSLRTINLYQRMYVPIYYQYDGGQDDIFQAIYSEGRIIPYGMLFYLESEPGKEYLSSLPQSSIAPGFTTFQLKLFTGVHFNRTFDFDPYVGFELLFTGQTDSDSAVVAIAVGVTCGVFAVAAASFVITAIAYPPLGKRVFPFAYRKHEHFSDSQGNEAEAPKGASGWHQSTRPGTLENT